MVDTYELGSAYNYVPNENDTDIHGSLIFSGVPSMPYTASANLIKYSIYLDYSVGNFSFGEIGLFVAGQLFALGSANALISKVKTDVTVGNSVRIDTYLSMVGTNYEMWFDLAESSNQFQIATILSPDYLPMSSQATPNVYVLQGADSSQSSILAYTDRVGLWNFDAYQFAQIAEATILSADGLSVTISVADYVPEMSPQYFGQLILELVTGVLYSTCRYVKTAIISGLQVTLGFDTQMAQIPAAGDRFRIFMRNQATSVAPVIPIATVSVLGGIKIGAGLSVTLDGTCSVDTASFIMVTSVNGETGDIVINAANLPNLATVGKTGNYNDLTNKPIAYNLPAMSLIVRGGAKLPPSGNLILTSGDILDLSFTPVKTVNGTAPNAGGNVTLVDLSIGLVNPTAVPSTANLNTYTTTGLFTVSQAAVFTIVNSPAGNLPASLEVVPLNPSGTGDVIQRWTTDANVYWRKLTGAVWSGWQQTATNAVATTTTLGIVKIGSGLSVDGAGLVTANAQPIASASVFGVIKVGAGLTINGSGVLSTTYSPTLATASAPGIVQIGSGLSVDVFGVLSTAALAIATTTTLGVVKVGSGLAIDGAGLLTASGASIATASVLGIVKIGAGLGVDGAGLLTLNVASASVLGGIKVGAGLTIIAGLLNTSLLTVNGLSPDVSGNIAVAADATKLDRINGIAQGLLRTFLDHGTVSGTVTFNAATADTQAATFTGGSVAWTLGGWPASGVYAEMQQELINAGLATHTFPAAVKFVNPAGTFTTSLATYMTNQRGAGVTNFQSSGTDFLIMWTRDGGTTVYAKVL